MDAEKAEEKLKSDLDEAESEIIKTQEANFEKAFP